MARGKTKMWRQGRCHVCKILWTWDRPIHRTPRCPNCGDLLARSRKGDGVIVRKTASAEVWPGKAWANVKTSPKAAPAVPDVAVAVGEVRKGEGDSRRHADDAVRQMLAHVLGDQAVAAVLRSVADRIEGNGGRR